MLPPDIEMEGVQHVPEVIHGPLPLTTGSEPSGPEAPQDSVTDDMLNAGQERLCQLSNITHFDDYEQAEVWKAMLRAAWQPIATAPKDGTYILAYPALLDTPLVVTWQPGKGWHGVWRMPMSEHGAPYAPTKWMPLSLLLGNAPDRSLAASRGSPGETVVGDVRPPGDRPTGQQP